MSPFDILARTFVRSPDAQQLRDSTVTPEVMEGISMSADAESFASLLKGLAGRPPGNSDSAPSTGAPEQLELPSDTKTADAVGADVASAVLSLLQGIVPNSDAQKAAGHSNENGPEGEATSQLPLEGMQQLQDKSDLGGLAKAPRLAVAVQHQETHFKPVIENVEAGRQLETAGEEETVSDPGPAGGSASADDVMPRNLNTPHLERERAANVSRVSDLPSHRTQAPVEPDARQEDTVSIPAHKQMTTRLDEQAKADAVPMRKSTEGTEIAELPPETLDGIASAVKSDLRRATDSAPAQPLPVNEAIRTISIKPSDNALRILNLQLHPADLGMVTIKMRLAGDSLEMELHVEQEDTAQMLRHDSEKLSALLRGSGYRPDTISIHVVDAAIQDRVITRTQPDTQMQGQSFPQGGASQGGRSRDQEKHHADTRAEQRKNADEGRVLDGPRPGGVYL